MRAGTQVRGEKEETLYLVDANCCHSIEQINVTLAYCDFNGPIIKALNYMVDLLLCKSGRKVVPPPSRAKKRHSISKLLLIELKRIFQDINTLINWLIADL